MPTRTAAPSTIACRRVSERDMGASFLACGSWPGCPLAQPLYQGICSERRLLPRTRHVLFAGLGRLNPWHSNGLSHAALEEEFRTTAAIFVCTDRAPRYNGPTIFV